MAAVHLVKKYATGTSKTEVGYKEYSLPAQFRMMYATANKAQIALAIISSFVPSGLQWVIRFYMGCCLRMRATIHRVECTGTADRYTKDACIYMYIYS